MPNARNLEATPLRRGRTFDRKLAHAFGVGAEGTGKLSKDSSEFAGVGGGHGLSAQLAYAIVQPARPGLRSEEAGEQVSVRRLRLVSFALVHSRGALFCECLTQGACDSLTKTIGWKP